VLSVDPTLIDAMSLVPQWNRIGQGGRRLVQFCTDVAAAKVELETWLPLNRARLRRSV
jgi:hypothetical protein